MRDDGQAAAAHGDAVADRHVAAAVHAGVDGDAHAVAVRRNRRDASDHLHDAGEHQRPPARHARDDAQVVADAPHVVERQRDARRSDSSGRARSNTPRAGSNSTDGATYSRISSTSPASSSAPLSCAPRLDVQLEDAAPREHAHHRGKVDATVGVRQRDALHARRPCGLRAPAVITSAPSPASTRRRWRRLRIAVDDDALRLARRLHRAHGQRGIVLQHGADAGEDRARARAPGVAVGARGFAGDPLARAVGERGAPVEARRRP